MCHIGNYSIVSSSVNLKLSGDWVSQSDRGSSCQLAYERSHSYPVVSEGPRS